MEEGAERLVLDFLMRQGRPVESPLDSATDELDEEDTPTFEQEDPEELRDDGASIPRSNEPSSMTRDQSQPQVPPSEPAAEPAVEATTSGNDATTTPTSDRSDVSFAERLGSMPFVSHGGTLLTAMSLSLAVGNRWESLIDRAIDRVGLNDAQRRLDRSVESA